MLHLGLLLLADPTSSTSNLKIAIVGALGVVSAAAIPAYLSTREKIRGRQQDSRDDPVKALIEANADLRRDNAELNARNRSGQKEVDRLERLLWGLGIDPKTGKQVREKPS